MQNLNCFEKTLCGVLKGGVIPSHIGFIMDGNRRHAKKLNLDNPIKGHMQGVKSVKKCLLICRQLGVQMVSLFCFSIENFKRSEQQVSGLMNLFLSTFDECSELTEYLLIQKIRVNIVGNTGLFKPDIQQCISKIEQRTKTFNKMVINLCFGYDSIWQSQQSIPHIKNKDGTQYRQFIQNLKIPKYLDVLVRTANQKRLSNFMLPQCAYCYICILKQHWPEVNIISYLKIIMEYNYYRKQIEKQRKYIKQLSVVYQSKYDKQITLEEQNQEQQEQKLNKNQQLVQMGNNKMNKSKKYI